MEGMQEKQPWGGIWETVSEESLPIIFCRRIGKEQWPLIVVPAITPYDIKFLFIGESQDKLEFFIPDCWWIWYCLNRTVMSSVYYFPDIPGHFVIRERFIPDCLYILFYDLIAFRHLRDSRHSITASPPMNRKPGTLIHRGISIPFMTTSHPKNNRRRCMRAMIKKTILPIIVKGFTIISLFS